MSLKYFNNLPDFKYQINNIKNKLLIIDFTATWCGPCRRLAPFFVSISNKEKYQDTCIFYKVDIDKNEDISTACNITSVPTFIIFYNGTILHEFSAIDKDTLLNNIQLCINHINLKHEIIPCI